MTLQAAVWGEPTDADLRRGSSLYRDFSAAAFAVGRNQECVAAVWGEANHQDLRRRGILNGDFPAAVAVERTQVGIAAVGNC